MMKIADNKNAVSFLKSMAARRLLPSDVTFSQVSFTGRHLVAFRVQPIPKAGEIFGLAPLANDSIGVTAFYDMALHFACCTLELTISAGGREYRYEYMLTREERRMLCEKMERFFLQRIGTELRNFSFEEIGVPMTPG